MFPKKTDVNYFAVTHHLKILRLLIYALTGAENVSFEISLEIKP
jgi:hypothetical protein